MDERLDYNRVAWGPVAGLVVLGLALIPFDGPIGAWVVAAGRGLTGDVRREIEAWGQYGQGVCVAVVAVVFVRLAPWRWRRVLDLIGAAGLTWAVTFAIKVLVGRPRPRLGDAGAFVGPFSAYPVGESAEARHSWEVWARVSSDLWSMPSSHVAYAAMLSVFIAAMEPRLRWLAAALTGVVALSRVVVGAHYPSDVLVGAAVGLACGQLVVGRGLGVRGLDWVWKRAVDRGASSAWPGVVAAERERGVR